MVEAISEGVERVEKEALESRTKQTAPMLKHRLEKRNTCIRDMGVKPADGTVLDTWGVLEKV